ncbi:MAG TPA: ketopantoate reductase family protein [Syntrophomonadaceae bacterium]|nr:ketopantoate reductase family protein [Syntrophomonadaceae bacterium]
MKGIETISLIGLGALGSAFASQIAKFLPWENIRVIAGGERAERYKTEGIDINGENLKFNVFAPEEKCEPADLLIFAVKFNQLDEAIEQAKNHIGNDTIIISLLNGITSEEIIGSVYGMEKMIYSVSFGIDAVRKGNSVNYQNLGSVAFGEKINILDRYSDKVLRLKEFFTRTQINYSIPEDMLRTLWWKFMLNVGINQTSAVLHAPYGVFQSVKEARDIMIAAMQEVINISAEADINLGQADIEELLKVIGGLSPTGKTSMLQDIEAGRQTEVNIFAGTMVELGKKYGVHTPVNQMLLAVIRAKEEMFEYLLHMSD